MGCDILFTRSCQRSLVHLVLEITGKRAVPPVAGIQCPGLVAIVNGEDITALQQVDCSLHPTYGIEIDFCPPSITELSPGDMIAIQVAGNLSRTGLPTRFTQAHGPYINVYF